MYLTADTLKIDTDEGEFVLECETCDGERFTVNIHGIDLDAFYDQVRSRIGPYLRERDEARRTAPVAAYDAREAYDLSDPKHPDFHSVHADIWDARDGK
jgi:hypothetical protein